MPETTPQAQPSKLLQELFIHPDTPYGAYPFDQIKEEYFPACMQEAIELHRNQAVAIAQNPEPPTFANTILALEESGAALEAVSGAFYNLLHAASTPELRRQAEEYSPLLARLGADISLNADLFARIRTLYEKRDELNLDPIDARLLKQTYDGFVDSGALLEGADREAYRRITEELSALTTQFAQNKLQDEQEWSRLFAPGTPSLSKIPEAIRSDAQQKASEKDPNAAPGTLLFNLSAPHYSAVMRFCSDPTVREEFYRARQSVGYRDNAHSNVQTIRGIVDLRLSLARLMGYKTYSHYALKDRMLSTPQQVQEMLETLSVHYKDHALKEMKQLEEFAGVPIQPWDISYYMERYSEENFHVKEEELRPYFPLRKVLRGIFEIARRLYGLSFSARPDIPVYHPDMQVYEVKDPEHGFLGLLYLDFFPREGKQSGAWMNNLQEYKPRHRPHIVLVMNFTPPQNGAPALLSLGEVNTLLHEFGHSLQGLLTQTRYSSQSGTNVQRDYVELPSQFMENFLRKASVVKEILSEHHQTGESLPDELIERLRAAGRFGAGYATMRQLFFGTLDMAYHHREEPLSADFDPKAFEDKWCAPVAVTATPPAGCCTSASFGHIFSGGYASGYYGYKWSEILDADAFSLFMEKGLWDRQTAQAFRRYILEPGDEAEPMQLYKQFRGREPRIDALLERDFKKEADTQSSASSPASASTH